MIGRFFALFDDIATLMDDVATMTKVATKNTVGVLGDDLAVNAHQLSGLSPKRELPVVWSVFKGSLRNKLILVPLALFLSAFVAEVIAYLLLAGGLFLCFEGAEKAMAWVFATKGHEKPTASGHPNALEQAKIRAAVTTDFILSAEIVVIALGILQQQNKPLAELALALAAVAIIITCAVYGAVALIVKLDDIGLNWARYHHGALATFGRGLVWFAPNMLKALTILGTLAMFVVGGQIWSEHTSIIGALLHHWEVAMPQGLRAVWRYVLEFFVGLVLGGLALALFRSLILLAQKLRHA